MSKDDEKLTDEENAALESVEDWSIQLGSWLKRQRLFKYLLNIFEKSETNGSRPVTWQNLVDQLSREELGFNDYPKNHDRAMICASFFALVAQAREVRSEHAFPLVPTQVQLWIRELRRLGRLVHDKPVFSWLDEPTQDFPIRIWTALQRTTSGANIPLAVRFRDVKRIQAADITSRT